LEEDNERRREISKMYENGLDSIQTIKMSPITSKSSRHLFQICVNNRNRIMEYLNSQGVYPGVHYRDNTRYDMYKYALGSCPFSLDVSEKLISLPLHMNLSDDDVTYVIEKVNEANKLFNL